VLLIAVIYNKMKSKHSFPKGVSGNPEGRPKGAVNKVTRSLRESITSFLEDRFDEVKTTWDKLSDKDKVNFYRDLLQYAIPRLQNTELKTDFDTLTDEDLDKIINELKKQAYEQVAKN
jgi:hypothetical protein